MLVRDMKRLARIRMHNLAIHRDDEAILSFINMGIADLYRRFDLRVKSETVVTNSNLAVYELRSPDVLMLIGVYDHRGRELQQTDVLESTNYDYKIVNYRTFMLRKPFDGYLYALYKASSDPVKDDEDIIDLPDAMLDALLAYITYSSHYTINRDNMNEADMFFQRYLAGCKVLEDQGYRMSLNTERVNMITKGFV